MINISENDLPRARPIRGEYRICGIVFFDQSEFSKNKIRIWSGEHH